MFLVYNLVCELTMRRCLGSLVTGLQWHGSPPRWRRVAYCFTYTAAFVPYVIFPLWQAIPNLAAQWLWGKYVGGTIHSWLVGLESENMHSPEYVNVPRWALEYVLDSAVPPKLWAPRAELEKWAGAMTALKCAFEEGQAMNDQVIAKLLSQVEHLAKLIELLAVRMSELQDKQQMQQEAITRLARTKVSQPGTFMDEK